MRFPSLSLAGLLALASPVGADLLAGAHKVNIAANPGPDDVWERDASACSGAVNEPTNLESPWPENPNCIYPGGNGIGTVGHGVITDFDTEYGLWSRSVAISDGANTVVLTILDGASYFGKYASMCERCGAFDLAEDLGAELGIDPAGFVFATTHAHAAPDFIGGWGGVPRWYMEQVANALRDSVRGAVANMVPARIEVGETLARPFNNERRDTYRSAEEAALSWFRAYTVDGSGDVTSVIATVATYAAHEASGPVGGTVAHAGWPGIFEKGVEDRFGGTGLFFMSGLGNMSQSGGDEVVGLGLANLIPEAGQGIPLVDESVRARHVRWNQPVTNSALTVLGVPGFFDRAIEPTPGNTVVFPKGGNKPCTSASPLSVDTGVTAIRIGSNLVITAGPGELFSNITNTIKERVAPAVALPMAQANDGLGYIMQSFEFDPLAGQALGFVGGNFFEYEDAYAIDGCFGDTVLEETLSALGGL